MGAWGTGIFQDDTACDIRDEYRDLIGNGASGTDATRQILKSYARRSLILMSLVLFGFHWPQLNGKLVGLNRYTLKSA